MEKFKPQKMVGWFDVGQLADTGIRAVLSSVFGSYADKRETIASISDIRLYRGYCEKDELWLDYISDTGDGFDSTFTMAHLIAQNQLNIKNENTEQKLPRAKVVVFGGDEVYPTPSRELYQNRFIGPMDAAATWIEGGSEADLYAVPGNHDWYDGLTNFVKIFCQDRWIGSWKTKQNRSYFAIQLTKNTWLWAIDIQLDADIDQPQLKYFDAAAEQMNKNDKVILCTAEPSWIYHTSKNTYNIYQNLEFFERKYIAEKGFEQILTLAGDLHHYARYSQNKNGKVYHKLTAGGGGAFMHPTHNLPDKLINMRDGDFDLKTTFPEKKVSKKMAWGDLLFPFYNVTFGVFLAVIHLLFAWSLFITSSFDSLPGDIFDELKTLGISNIHLVYDRLMLTFSHSPIALLILVVFVVGFYQFCDTNSSKLKYIGILGAIHGVLHIVLMMLSLWMFSYLNFSILHVTGKFSSPLLFAVEAFCIGGGLASSLTGVYLLFCNLVFGIHDNEAFSAMKIEGYKNFLRMHFKDNVLTIYPIGLKKVAHWKEQNGKYTTTDLLQPELMESPIIINLN